MRRYPERPIVGVGAVILDQRRVVLVRRANEPLKGLWSLPGGTVHVGETLVAAVAREVLEETGLDVHVGLLVDVLDRVHPGADGRVEYHFVLLDYLCRVVGGTLSAASDAAEACWVDVDRLSQYALTDGAAAVIAKALGLSDHAR